MTVARPRRRLLALGALALASIAYGLALGAIFRAVAQPLPIDRLAPKSVTSRRLLDRHGILLREILARPDGRAHWVDLDAISPHLIAATLASEDQRFYEHAGVDPRALLRALLLNVTHGRIMSGGSTLTMQLARLLSPEPRSLGAKTRQITRAIKLEALLSKTQILTQYLNRAPYGGGSFGVEAAARRYFAKPAAEVSLAEATLLAALPRSPQGYSPLQASGRRRVRRRQRYILAMMRRQKRIDDESLRIALAEPLALERLRRPFLAPHFANLVLQHSEAHRSEELRTTLDIPLQTHVEAIVRDTLRDLRSQGVGNAAVIVADNATGDVLAYVGSQAFNDPRGAGQVDGTRALRQPGSALKPFVYALAFAQGLTPASLLPDLPTHFTTDHGDYAPRNYDGRFRGPVRARVALASSLNIPALRVAARVGVPRLLDALRTFGFSSLKKNAKYYGLGLALGDGEVTLRQLVAAYAMLARGGRFRPLRILQAYRPAGVASWTPIPLPRSTHLISPQATYLVSNILSDPRARIPTFGRNGPLETPFFAAVKTGTSKDFRDNWTVGFTSKITVGVWVGNFDGSSMHNVSGVTGAGPLWREIIEATRRDLRIHDDSSPAPPRGLAHAQVCPLSGALAGPDCPSPRREVFLLDHIPTETCSFHRRLAIDRKNGLRAGPGCPASITEDRTFIVYPPRYRAWAASQGLPRPPARFSPRCPAAPGSSGSDATTDQTAPFRIHFPAKGDVFYLDPDVRRRDQGLPLEVLVEGSPKTIAWFVDGHLLKRSPYPYNATWPIQAGIHRLQARLPGGRKTPVVRIEVR